MFLSAALLLCGCAKEFSYKPKKGGTFVPSGEITSHTSGSTTSEEEEVLTCTYNFYFSYSHTTQLDQETRKDVECPIFSLVAPMLSPLGTCPSEVDSEQKVKELGALKGFSVDETFPTWLGFSFNGVCLDESGLWNFESDYRQLAVVNLYGIWVSE